MRKIPFMLPIILLFLFVLLPLPKALAQSGSSVAGPGVAKPMVFPPPNQNPLLGQQQQYSVTFRGNGEAIVLLKTVFSNVTDRQQTSVSFRFPRVSPQDLIAYQVVGVPQCLRYGPVEIMDRQQQAAMMPPPPCAEYSTPDFMPYYGSYQYKRAQVSYVGDTATVMLPQPVAMEKTGSIILYYRASGYARRTFAGSFAFAFETLKTQDRIERLTVGIATDADQHLKGARGTVSYRFDATTAKELAAPAAAGAALAGGRMDSLFNTIGTGEIVKTASNLQPLDAFIVRGEYADSWVRLYAKEGLGVLAAAILFIVLLVLAARKFMMPGKTEPAQVQSRRKAALAVGAAFASSVCIAGYTALLVFVAKSNFFGLVEPPNEMFLALFVAVISLGIYSLLLFGPTLVAGIRYGIRWGLTVFGLTMLLLIVDAIVLIGVLVLFRVQLVPQPYQEIPVMMTNSQPID